MVHCLIRNPGTEADAAVWPRATNAGTRWHEIGITANKSFVFRSDSLADQGERGDAFAVLKNGSSRRFVPHAPNEVATVSHHWTKEPSLAAWNHRKVRPAKLVSSGHAHDLVLFQSWSRVGIAATINAAGSLIGRPQTNFI